MKLYRGIPWLACFLYTLLLWLPPGKAAAGPDPMAPEAGSLLPGQARMGSLDNGYRVTFAGVQYNRDGTSTWHYRVEELPGARDLRDWMLELPGCTRTLTATPGSWQELYPEPISQLNGVRWQVDGDFSAATFRVTVTGHWSTGTVRVAARGTELAYDTITGPACTEVPELQIDEVAEPSLARVGDVLTYTVTLTNTSRQWSQQAILTDVLPAGITYVGSSTHATTGQHYFDPETNQIRWKGVLAPGGSARVTFQGWVREEVPPGATLVNNGQVASGRHLPPVVEQVTLASQFAVTFTGVTYHPDGTSTWRYRIEELSAGELSNWTLALPACTRPMNAAPASWEIVNPDPASRLSGVRWKLESRFTRGGFSVRVRGHPAIGNTRLAAGGERLAYGRIAGPLCDEAAQYEAEATNLAAAITVAERVMPDWVLLVYLSGDNNLDKVENRIVQDRAAFNALEAAATRNPRLQIYVQWDRSGNPEGVPEGSETHRYRIRPDLDPYHLAAYTPGVDVWGIAEQNMGQPETLTDFIRWARGQYTASYEMLSIIGHGGGWTPTLAPDGPAIDYLPAGIAWDDTSRDYLSTREMGQALATATDQQTRPIDILLLDASGMATLENAYEVRGSVHYLVASQGAAWAPFPYESYLTGVDGGTEPRTLAAKIVRDYAASLKGYPLVMGGFAIDLAKIEPVAGAVDEMAVALSDTLTTARPIVEATYEATQKFDSDWDLNLASPDSALDLYDFAMQLESRAPESATALRTATAAVRNALNDALLAQFRRNGSPWIAPSAAWAYDGANGLSLFVPLGVDTWLRDHYRASELSLAEDTRWDEFLHSRWYQGRVAPTLPSDAGGEAGGVQPIDPARRPGLYPLQSFWLFMPINVAAPW